MFRRPATSPLFPYTTLFRSHGEAVAGRGTQLLHRAAALGAQHVFHFRCFDDRLRAIKKSATTTRIAGSWFLPRSEEHTSELQSHHDLVCPPLLEKENRTRIQ